MIDAAGEIAELRARLAEREAELATARAELTGARILIEQMKAQLAKPRRMQFGRSSEKLDRQIAQLELMLEDLEEGEAARTAPSLNAESEAPERRKRERRQPVRFSPDRKGERPRDHLGEFSGVIQADAYPGYEALTRPSGPPGLEPPGIAHAACWAHARRHLYDEFEKTNSPIAEEALRRIGQLYEIEAAITGKTAKQCLAARQEHAVPILDALKQWFEAQQRRLSSKSTLSKAIQYALSRWDSLVRYVADGRIGIDNNPAERSLRGIAPTRKNSLFLGSEAGGDPAAILYTVLETAKLNGLDPEAYLADVIDRMAEGHVIIRLAELLP